MVLRSPAVFVSVRFDPSVLPEMHLPKESKGLSSLMKSMTSSLIFRLFINVRRLALNGCGVSSENGVKRFTPLVGLSLSGRYGCSVFLAGEFAL